MAPDQVILDVYDALDRSSALDADPTLVSMNTWLLNVSPGEAVGNVGLDIIAEHDEYAPAYSESHNLIIFVEEYANTMYAETIDVVLYEANR